MITWEQFLTQKHVYEIIDINTVPSPLLQDYVTRNDNVVHRRILCERCNGTGNEFMFTYSRCRYCFGKGYLE
jgi:hypothetical protein